MGNRPFLCGTIAVAVLVLPVTAVAEDGLASIWRSVSVDQSHSLIGIIASKSISDELLSSSTRPLSQSAINTLKRRYAKIEFTCTDTKFDAMFSGTYFDNDSMLQEAVTNSELSKNARNSAFILDGKYTLNLNFDHGVLHLTGGQSESASNSARILDHLLDNKIAEISVIRDTGLTKLSFDTDPYREANWVQISKFLNGCSVSSRSWMP